MAFHSAFKEVSMMLTKPRHLGLALGLFVASTMSLAQETRASLSGIVADATGSAIPGVSIQ